MGLGCAADDTVTLPQAITGLGTPYMCQEAKVITRTALTAGHEQNVRINVQEERDRAQKQAAAAAVEEVEEEEEPMLPSPTSNPKPPAAAAATSSLPQPTHSASAASSIAVSEPSTGPASAHPPTDGVHRLEAAPEQEELGGLEIRCRPASEPETGGLEAKDRRAVGDQSGAGTLSSHVRGMVARMDAGKQDGMGAAYAPSQKALLTRDEVKRHGSASTAQGAHGTAASADDEVSLDT